MIKYLTNEEIDRKKWDACIQDAFNGMVYACSWYLDIVAEGWEALIENDYESVFPLVNGKKWGINYLFQPAFTQQLGIFSKNLLTEKVVEDFLLAIPGKYKFAEINLNTFNKVDPEKFQIDFWKNHELDLIKAYDGLFRSYSTNLRRNVRKGIKSNLSVLKSTRPEEIITLFRNNRGREINVLSEEHYHQLQRISYTGIYKGLIQTYAVYTSENDLCAGAIFLKNKKKMIFLFSGLSSTGKEKGAMPYLIDAFIKDHAQQHLTLDFEGSNDPDLARFYKSFGSEECFYPHLKSDRMPGIIRLGVKLAKKMRK
ncbi:MAG: hypothetical protein DRJ05_18640 [Bacteroidetes bacterium]|nr:MAG: hypothetical protein DRJ05_18640 [Bacteroidota bacterium]